MKFLSSECYRTPLMASQHGFRWWLGTARQQAITWANVEPVFHHCMVSQFHNGWKANFKGSLTGTYLGWKFISESKHWWCPYASVSWTIIGSCNGLLSDWHQATTFTIVSILLYKHKGTDFGETDVKNKQSFFSRKCIGKNIHFKISAILFRPQCVKLFL